MSGFSRCTDSVVRPAGIALQDAQANGFVADLPNNASAKMGLLHAVYGECYFLSPSSTFHSQGKQVRARLWFHSLRLSLPK